MHYLIMWQGQRSPVRLATRHAGEAFASRLRQLGARNVIVFPAYGPPVSRRPQPLKEEPAERVSVYAPLTIAPWRL